MGLIFDIQRFSVHDGPGIRTTFFLKGCPLRCRWCHNPEGLEHRVQLQYLEESCIGCGDCEAACRHGVHLLKDGAHQVDFSRCRACGNCASVCPSGALRLIGRELTPEEICREAMRDLPFYGESGGVTFSGGEATMQPEFLMRCLGLCRENGISTAVDTCGNLPRDSLQKLIPLTDLFLYDIKAVTPEIHRAGTGADNRRILENYRYLAEAGCRIWVRIPVIGGFNASREEMEKISDFLRDTPGAEQITLMPYHRLGAGKYVQVGRQKDDDTRMPVTHEQMEEWFHLFALKNLPVERT